MVTGGSVYLKHSGEWRHLFDSPTSTDLIATHACIGACTQDGFRAMAGLNSLLTFVHGFVAPIDG
jgi:hypothetical protein